MKPFLEVSEIIDYLDTDIQTTAQLLAKGCLSDIEIAKNCFEYVRDEIRHTGDYQDQTKTTYLASDVLKYKTGWCYAKSHLLAALLRANNIPAGFCYQRLFCDEYKKDSYCLHGLNAVYLKKYGWYRIDARGNKQGINAQFIPPNEMLAFELREGELDLPDLLHKPLALVIANLKKNTTYEQVVDNFSDLK